MLKIEKYPYTFKLGSDSFEIQESTLRKIKGDGREERTSFDGKIVGVGVFEEYNEFVITVSYDKEIYCISKQKGWFGPFSQIEDVYFDADKGVSVVKGSKVVKNEYPLMYY